MLVAEIKGPWATARKRLDDKTSVMFVFVEAISASDPSATALSSEAGAATHRKDKERYLGASVTLNISADLLSKAPGMRPHLALLYNREGLVLLFHQSPAHY